MSGIFALTDNTDTDNDAFRRRLKMLNHRGSKNDPVIYNESKLQIGEITGEENNASIPLAVDGLPLFNNQHLKKEQLFNIISEKGLGVLEEINGSFALIGSYQDDFFAYRDIWGSKPLYYAKENGHTAFASEIKALQNYGDTVNLFPPGNLYTVKDGFQNLGSKIAFAKNQVLTNQQQATRDLYQTLLQAVEKSLTIDKEFGIFLSGGLDSAIIAACAKKFCPAIKTFSVGVKNSEDLQKAQTVAKYLNTDHFELIYSVDEIKALLNKIIFHLESFDVELVNSSIANYLVADLAKKHGLEVCLSGEGADELFAGYHYLKNEQDQQKLEKHLLKLLTNMHSSGLQRVDRMTAVHGLSCVMPFLDQDVVDLALKIPAQWKIKDNTEKYILRAAFAQELPDSVLWRKKEQFGIGSGTDSIMKELVTKEISLSEYQKACADDVIDFKNLEEYYYFRIFKKHFPQEQIQQNVNRWLY